VVLVAKASAEQAAAARREIRRVAAQLLQATANPDGEGLLLRGQEYAPKLATDFDPLVLKSMLRLARLAEAVGDSLRDCPDATVRASAALLAARAHPIRAALDA
jgi:hypothetical protein